MNNIKMYVSSLGRPTRAVILALAVVFVSAGIAQAATTISTNVFTGGTLGALGVASFGATATSTFDSAGNLALNGTLTLNVATTTFSDTSTLATGNMNGTTLTSMLLTPKASVGTSDNYYKLVSVGDVTGNTAFGFGATTAPTVGFMASFGRTVAAASGTFTDTGLDARAINKLDNSNATYTLQGAYIKASNYAGAKVANLKGLFVEAVGNGTISGSSYGIDIGTSGSTITSLIHTATGKAAYGLDMNGSTFSTADIRLGYGDTISNTAASTTVLSSNLTIGNNTAATSTLTVGCIQTTATSSATKIKLIFSTAGATSTYNGTAYWSYGTCP